MERFNRQAEDCPTRLEDHAPGNRRVASRAFGFSLDLSLASVPPSRPGSTTRADLISHHEIASTEVLRNLAPARLYELALAEGATITSTGALATFSGKKTGRSPRDKRIVDNPESTGNIWWGPVNAPISPEGFATCRREAIDYLAGRTRVYVVDGFAGWDPEYRIKVRVLCAQAYHALFMHNMLIRPTPEELDDFGEPEFVIYNAGDQPADQRVDGITSTTAVLLNLEQREVVILGTNYAGEMKKGVFTAMHYWMPERGVLSMHCSANEGDAGDVSLFFGLSGTGKTTLSTDPRRRLLGDDEHCWSDHGIFNIEGGCYAKCIGLTERNEPQVFRAIRFGSLLENVVSDARTRVADYDDGSITENTRACYPIEFIENARVPCVARHPSNIIFLACDAFGVLPPVSRLSTPQVMHHFLSGYTAKTAGTEVGVVEPEATFSACFGAAFLVLHPVRYAELLAEKIRQHKVNAWLVNTGWSGGPYGIGARMKLDYTRAAIDAIHDGSLARARFTIDPIFGLEVPTTCPNVPSDILAPRTCWPDADAYDHMARRLARLFHDNFQRYADYATDEIRAAGPCV
jgi:phosphoenolpyruvate carboxykinase (ATP)